MSTPTHPVAPTAASTYDAEALEMIITRQLAAPRALVFQAWTEAEHLARWWGPRGFNTTVQEFNLQPGGVWRFIMRSYDGTEYPNRILFEEIVAPERLVYRHDADDDDQDVAMRTVVTFAEQGDKTQITMRVRFATTAGYERALAMGALEGGNSTLDCLEAHLSTMIAPAPRSERELTMARFFSAPRELVFRAFSAPEHLEHWWGPAGWTLPVCKQDFRVGGEWHYCMRGPDGMESWGKAVYQEIVEPERIVYLDMFSDADGNAVEGMPQMVITVEFHAVEGGTQLVSRTEFASAEDLRATVAMGAVQGMYETWTRLAEYLA